MAQGVCSVSLAICSLLLHSLCFANVTAASLRSTHLHVWLLGGRKNKTRKNYTFKFSVLLNGPQPKA